MLLKTEQQVRRYDITPYRKINGIIIAFKGKMQWSIIFRQILSRFEHTVRLMVAMPHWLMTN